MLRQLLTFQNLILNTSKTFSACTRDWWMQVVSLGLNKNTNILLYGLVNRELRSSKGGNRTLSNLHRLQLSNFLLLNSQCHCQTVQFSSSTQSHGGKLSKVYKVIVDDNKTKEDFSLETRP